MERTYNNSIKKARLHRYTQVLMVLGFFCKENGKNYCFPSQDKILSILKEKYGVSYSRRHLNRILNAFEQAGYFKRRRRLKRGKHGGLIQNSTLYILKGKAFKWLGKLGLFLKKFVMKMSKRLEKAAEQGKPAFDPFALKGDSYQEALKKMYEKQRQRAKEKHDKYLARRRAAFSF